MKIDLYNDIESDRLRILKFECQQVAKLTKPPRTHTTIQYWLMKVQKHLKVY